MASSSQNLDSTLLEFQGTQIRNGLDSGGAGFHRGGSTL